MLACACAESCATIGAHSRHCCPAKLLGWACAGAGASAAAAERAGHRQCCWAGRSPARRWLTVAVCAGKLGLARAPCWLQPAERSSAGPRWLLRSMQCRIRPERCSSCQRPLGQAVRCASGRRNPTQTGLGDAARALKASCSLETPRKRPQSAFQGSSRGTAPWTARSRGLARCQRWRADQQPSLRPSYAGAAPLGPWQPASAGPEQLRRAMPTWAAGAPALLRGSMQAPPRWDPGPTACALRARPGIASRLLDFRV